MERRHLIFFLLAAMLYLGWMTWFGPKPRPKPKADVAKKQVEGKKAVVAKDDKAKAAPAVKAGEKGKENTPEIKPALDVALRDDLVLGKPDDDKFHIFAKLSNRGGVVTRLTLNKYKTEDFKGPLVLIREETPDVNSFALTLLAGANSEDLTDRNWEVVESTPERVVFRTKALEGKVQIEKRFTLEPEKNTIGLAVAAKNLTKDVIPELAYTLTGGNGLPIEGTWYTRYFRNLTCLMIPTDRAFPKLEEVEATTIASKAKDGKDPEKYAQHPIQYAGVVSQYFASEVMQKDLVNKGRVIASVVGVDLDDLAAQTNKEFERLLRRKENQFHNIGVEVTSIPVPLPGAEEFVHDFLLYNGPKREQALQQYADYNLPMLIHYPDFMLIPIGLVAQFMVWVLNVFYSITRDYGIAIILLTVAVRSCMFPLSFRQSQSMMKMQALQPKMEEIKAKYPDDKDKEKRNRAIMDLYAKEKVNPIGGCLPVLFQMPIFVGLYQSLYASFSLRQSTFFWGYTWIKDLSAPDQLFRFGMDLPVLGPAFNLLPVLAVIQMVLQARYMSPPPTTPEAKMQRNMMMFMMIFFGYMFYNVPAGLCVYIITSGAWSMMERKLLPKPKLATGAVATVPTEAKTSTNGATWMSPVKKKGKSKK